jgi:glyoxylase-like metal-dependent hydrolase (beta-lactamase superfamily II)
MSNIKKLVEGLTRSPASVLNSHTHNDHVGDNCRFSDIYQQSAITKIAGNRDWLKAKR